MADKTLFGRLRRLFSTNVIVRNVGGRKLKVADTEKIQSILKQIIPSYKPRIYNPHLEERNSLDYLIKAEA